MNILKEKYDELKMDCLINVMKPFLNDDGELQEQMKTREEEDYYKDFSKQIALLVVSSELWKQTGDEEYLNEMCQRSSALWGCIYKEILEMDEDAEEPDINIHYNGLLWLLVGNSADYIQKCKKHGFLYEDEEGYFNGWYFSIKAVNMAWELKLEGLEEAAQIVIDRLKDFKFEYDWMDNQWHKQLALLRICQYYLQDNSEKAYSFYLDHEYLLRAMNSEEYVYFLNDLSEQYEMRDINVSVTLIEEAYQIMENSKMNIPLEKRWMIRYNNLVFGMKKNSAEVPLEQVEQLYQEIASEKVENIQLVEILKMKIDFILVYHNKKVRNYLKNAEEFYFFTVKYKHLFDDHPFYNQKMAAHLLACEYSNQGKRGAAEAYFIEASQMIEENNKSTTDYYIRLNLCILYITQNNLEKAKPLIRELYRDVIKGVYHAEVSQSGIQTCILMFSNVFDIERHRRYAAKVVRKALEYGIIYFTDEDAMISSVYNSLIYRTIGIQNELPDNYKGIFKDYIDQIENSRFFKDMRPEQLVEHYGAKALLGWKLGNAKMYQESRRHAVEALAYVGKWAKNLTIGMYGYFLAADMHQNEKEAAVVLCRHINSMNLETLGDELLYQNKKRLLSYVKNYDISFFMLYSVMCQAGSVYDNYNLVLNYKNLASLVTVFRNHAIDKIAPAKEIIREINSLMDRISDEKVRETYGMKSTRVAELQKQLSEKEAIFSKKIHSEIQFTPFHIKEMIERIPDNSIFLEYVRYFNSYYDQLLYADYMDPDNIVEKYQIDIFCFVKKNGETSVTRYTVQDSYGLLESILYYEQEMGRVKHKNTIQVRRKLYDILIAPVRQRMGDLKKLYIAPDGQLNNIPFEMLMDETEMIIGDQFDIVMLSTGRDFIRKSEADYNSHMMIVGNPAYDYNDILSGSSILRKIRYNKKIRELPFSELEAYIVADELGEIPYVEQRAKKSIVNQFENANWIHIATHGTCDIEKEEDAWYSSALLFAGSENWRNTGIEHPIFGNGVVTADEISRLHLQKTEMVVLSSCFTGMVEPNNMAGIRSAFRDAGVKYVISALWQVDDIAATLFMSSFYSYVKVESIPVALNKAKVFLRNITIGKVIEMLNGYLEKFDINSSSNIRQAISGIQEIGKKYSKDYKIYNDPYYWSAFICYQNTF